MYRDCALEQGVNLRSEGTVEYKLIYIVRVSM